MHTFLNFRVALTFGLLLVGACSESDATSSSSSSGAATSSSSGGSSSSSSSGGSDAGTPAAGGFIYSSQPQAASAEATLTLLNAQGGNGAAYVGPLFSASLNVIELFVKPSQATTFSYVSVPADASTQTKEGFIAALNAKGAMGFAFKGPLSFGSTPSLFFVKDTRKPRMYTYAFEPVGAEEATITLTLNSKGSQGFSYLGDYIANPTDLGTNMHLFQRVASPATYTYEFTTALQDRAALLAEVNSKGQTGAVWKGGYAMGVTTLSLYEKASTTSGAVSFKFENDDGDRSTSFLAQLNTVAADGYFFSGPYIVGTTSVNVFFKGAMTALPLLGTVLP